MPVADVRAAIASAFQAAPHPGDDALVSGDVSYDPEYRDVAQAFAGRHWRDLAPAFIREQRDALPLLSPAAFRFFLPAYLLACAQDEQDLDTAPLSVALNLTPPEPSDRASLVFFEERTGAFTAAEASAICAYLDVAQPEGMSDQARQRALGYWRSRAG